MLFLGKKMEEHGMDVSMVDSPEVASSIWKDDFYSSSVIPHVPALSNSGRRVCGNIQCTGSWSAPWRNRKRPVFETQWGCSGRCVLELVRAALRRESGEKAVDEDVSQHQHRMPLGLLLLSQGWITHSQLQNALRIQRGQGGRIGEILIAECGVNADYVARGLSLQWNRPVLGAHGFSPRSMALVMPKVFVEQFGMLPLRVAGSRILYVGFEDRPDASVLFGLERMSELRVESGLVKTEEYHAALRSLLEDKVVETREEFCGEVDALAVRITAVLEQKQPVASRLVRMRQFYWLRLWLETRSLRGFGNLPQSSEDMMDYVFRMS
ncbi:hypothetical protein [Edaphobacter albus]|uniref:hypothetical protein n=1 Tax=Edaphobacter sp. 4G125 TaxID=2763071 RepID=UPI001645771B|nr:hypothetical protein [Edaphobacter sp. 4G125]QNI35283.1 hypothetical protein H7846_09195 [Edaphobacter sp. 4G125]